MKKLFHCLLCCLMMTFLLGLTQSALAASTSITVDGVIYTPLSSTDTKCKVSGLAEDFSSDTLILPSTVTDPEDSTRVYSVTQIDSSALPAGVIKSLTVPASFTSLPAGVIESGAIEEVYCEEGSKITSVSQYAFQGNKTLKKIYLPDSITFIDRYAFNACYSLTTVRLPAKLTQMGDGCFDNCKALTELILPEGMTVIGSSAFYGCTSLRDVSIPASVTTIGANAFSGCTALSSVTLNEGLKVIDNNAFKSCPLESVRIPASVTTLYSNQYGTSFPTDCVLNVYRDSAAHTYAVENSLPFTLVPEFRYTVIDEDAKTCRLTEYICTDPYTTIEIPETLGGYTVTEIGERVFLQKSSLTSVTLPSSIKSIGFAAFNQCTQLTDINLPEGLESIGEMAFYGDSSLTSIVLPSTLISLGKRAFWDCTSLTSIELPSGLTSLGEEAFNGCDSLTSIELPSGLTSLGEGVFLDCGSLSTIRLPEEMTEIPAHLFDGCDSLTAIDLPVTIERIGDYAFSGCGVREFNLPQGLKSIGAHAFEYCSRVQEFNLPENLESLGDYAFTHCNGITGMELPSTLTRVPLGLLSYCANLTSVTLPSTITTIGSYAFRGSGFEEITLSSGVTSIGSYAFSNMPALRSITLPDTVNDICSEAISYNPVLTEIDISATQETSLYTAFIKNPSLTQISLPDSLTTVGRFAFYDNTSLASITLPESVTSIGEYAFQNDAALTSIYLPNSLQSIDSTAFENCPNLVLKVPQGSWAESYAWNNNCEYRITGYMPTALSAEDVSILYGESAFIPVTLTPAVDHKLVDGGAVSFVSADPSIAFVDDQGLVKGRKPGKTTVYVKSIRDPFLNDAITVTVTDMTSSQLFARAKTSRSGNTLYITYGARGGVAPYTIKVRSSALSSDIVKTNVAAENGEVTLSATGTVSAQQVQTVYVYVTVTDATGATDTATAKFEMTQKTTQVGVGTPRQVVQLVTDANGNTYYRYTTVYDSYTTVITYPESHISDWPGGNLISSITLSNESIALKPGESKTLTATTTPEGGSVVWLSSDYNIADVSESGVVTALSTGTAIISCCAVDGSGVQTECAVNCIESPVTDIEITAGKVDNATGMQQMTATLTPADATFQKVTWSLYSGDQDIATIDENGLVTWKEAGSIIVTATATDGSGVQKKFVAYWSGILVEKILPTRSADNPMQIAWLVEPANATNPNVTFAVDMPELLAVDKTGHMTYLGDGTVHVRLTAADGSGVTAIITIECFSHPDHTIVTIPAREATCTTDGNSGGSYCEVCGDVFQKDTVTPALGHSVIMTKAPVAATAASDGRSIEMNCERCGERTVESVVISRKRIVSLPASLTSLEAEALAGVNAQQIVLPEGTLTIGSRAFADCDDLRLVLLPDSLTGIAADAFEGCEDVMILCSEGSTAQRYAEQNHISCYVQSND